jgi:hypothetical protein
MATDPVKLCRRLDSLKSERQPHEAGWRECFDFSYPERGQGLNGNMFTAHDIQQKQNRILDDTAADSARTVAANFVSSTTPANALWLGFDAGMAVSEENEPDEEMRWLDNAARVIFENVQQSNFNAVSFDGAIDFVCAGWPVIYCDEEQDGGYRFEQWPIGQCYIASSRVGGDIDTIFRELEMTIEQAVTEYGVDHVSHQTSEAYRQEKFSDRVKILHAIQPRALYMAGSRRATNLPFLSCHVEIDTKHVLKEGGYHEFPCFIPRLSLIPGTAYAKGLMAQALGSIRTLNDIKALELSALDIAVSGMYVAEDDGVLNPRTITLGPRKIIVVNSVDSIKPLASGSKFDVTFSAEDRLQAQIRKIMLTDQLQPQDGPAMTATEVHVRVQLIRQLLGPMTARYENDLRRFVDRLFGLALRGGALGQPPRSLMERNFTAKFFSPLARAQRMEEIMAMDRMENTLLQEMQVDPTVVDIYDFEAGARIRHDFLGAPKKSLRSPEDVAKLRRAREGVQQQQQAAAMAQQLTAQAGEAIINKAAA